MKTAVVLFNLGAPDSLRAVRPFLFNLFNDPNIIMLPQPFRWLLARLISTRRNKKAQGIYAQLGGSSPLLANTAAQARALQLTLGNGFGCFIAMRYWRPFTNECVQAVKASNPDRIVLLPLYPQYSIATTASSVAEWHKCARKAGLNVPTVTIGSYPQLPGFLQATLDSIVALLPTAAQYGHPRILFSAHGVPVKYIQKGDPYEEHCKATVSAVVDALGAGVDAVLCYQSKVGPLEWLAPSTESEIERAGRDKVPVIVVPIAFVSEHSETLVELDIEYRELAHTVGVPAYLRAPTVSTAQPFIEGLAKLVKQAALTQLAPTDKAA